MLNPCGRAAETFKRGGDNSLGRRTSTVSVLAMLVSEESSPVVRSGGSEDDAALEDDDASDDRYNDRSDGVIKDKSGVGGLGIMSQT